MASTRRSVQLSLPPQEVEPVDRRSRDRADRSTDVDRWLRLLNQAIEESPWARKQDALATFMGIDKAYLSRLRSGEKPWRVEHLVGLPDDIESRFEHLRAESFGLVVVAPAPDHDSAVRDLVRGLVGVLGARKVGAA